MDLLQRELNRKKEALQLAKLKNVDADNQGRRRRYVKATELRRWVDEEEATHKDQMATAAAAAAAETSTATAPSDDSTEKDITSVNETKRTSERPPSKKMKTNSTTLAESHNISPPFALDRSTTGNANTTAINSTGTSTTNIPTLSSTQSQSAASKTLDQVQNQLRLLGVPITLFGERNLSDRIVRLDEAARAQADLKLHETEADEFRLGQGHGIRNPFLERDDDEAQWTASTASNTDPDGKHNNHKTTGKSNDDDNDDDKDDDADARLDPHKRIYRHFKGLLRQWEVDVNNRPDDVKRSLAGRNERKTVKQCKDYIRPLFNLCKRRQLEENLTQKLFAMVQFCEQGEFVRAHDAYLDVAIGRAAWPIGVTMVGIHARSGRAKIESSNVAHVMNSELQRKYLTSVKRLLTYEQSQRTDVDPSKKVLH